MNPHVIRRHIRFSYGHRILGYEGACKHAHGHNASAEFVLSADHLDSCGMVRDFSEIKRRLGEWIKENIDHRMILNRKDPLADALLGLGEPVFLMDENPTAENIARVLFEAADRAGFNPDSVTLWETSEQGATYRRRE